MFKEKIKILLISIIAILANYTVSSTETLSSVLYEVQIFTSKKSDGAPIDKLLKICGEDYPIKEYKNGDLYYYTVGSYKDKNKCIDFLRKIAKTCSEDAFMVIIKDGYLQDGDKYESRLSGKVIFGNKKNTNKTEKIIYKDSITENESKQEISKASVIKEDISAGDTALKRYYFLLKQADSAYVNNKIKKAHRLVVEALKIKDNDDYVNRAYLRLEEELFYYNQKKTIRKATRNFFDETFRRENKANFIIILIFYFVLIINVLISVILIVKILRSDKEYGKSVLEEQFSERLIEFAFNEEHPDDILPDIYTSVNNTFRKKVFIDEMVMLQDSLFGETTDKLKELFKHMRFHQYAISRLDSWLWNVKAKYIEVLTHMRIYMAYDLILEYINSPKIFLRSEAIVGVLSLDEEHSFEFLDKLEKPFTEWEQLRVYNRIVHDGITIPDFSKWFESPNDTVVIFAIRMVRSFKQFDNYTKLLKLLNHKNIIVRKETILTLGKCDNKDVVPYLKDAFNNDIISNEVEILKAMQHYVSIDDLDFYERLLYKENFYLRLEAARLINKIDGYSDSILDRIYEKNPDDKELRDIIKHVKDKRN